MSQPVNGRGAAPIPEIGRELITGSIITTNYHDQGRCC